MELQEGIILKTNKYQENSKIAYICTRNKILSAVIKASGSYKSKNYAYSLELTKIKFDCTNTTKESFDYIKSGEVVDSYLNIKTNESLFKVTLDLLVLLYQVKDFVSDYNNLYNLLDFTLNGINTSLNYSVYTYVFKLKLLYLLGVGPNFNNCVVCLKKSNDNLFSIVEGGYLCSKHSVDKIIFNSYYLNIIKILYLTKLDKFNDSFIEEIVNNLDSFKDINMFLYIYYSNHLDIDLNKISSYM